MPATSKLRPSLLAAFSLLSVVATAHAQSSDLSLNLEGSVDQTTVGQQIEYVLVVSNNGPDDTASFSLVDTLPPGQAYVAAIPTASVAGNTVTFAGGALSAGASATFRILSQATAAGSQVNSATVNGASADGNPANNSAQYPVAVIGTPTVTIAPTVPTAVCESGQPGQFTLTLSAAASSDLHVGYLIRGSATPGTDYVALKGTAKIKAGKTSKIISVHTEGDLGGADKKSVVLELYDGSGYLVGKAAKAKVKLLPAP